VSDLEQRLSKRKTKTFTSKKLDLMDAVDFDQRLDPYDKLVFRAIIRCLNAKTGKCYPSDDFIADMISSTRQRVSKARIKLRKCGYLTLIERQSDLTLDEVVCVLRKQGTRILDRENGGARPPTSRTSVWRFFKRHNITFKKNPARGGAATDEGRLVPALSSSTI